MENFQESWHSELIEKNRKILNEKLNDSIRQTGNKLFGLFFDMLQNSEIKKTENFLEKLKLENAKPSRIKRWEFHYKHLNDIQKSILKLLKQYFDRKFPEIASDPQIGGLYFNSDLKDLIRFDFIFGYLPHNPNTIDDTQNYTANFFLKGGYKQYEEQKVEETKKAKKTHHVWIPGGHKLLNTDNYTKYKETLMSQIQSSIQKYSKLFDIDINDNIKYKRFLEAYFIYILKDSLLESNLVMEVENTKSTEILKIIIQDIKDYLSQHVGSDLDIDVFITTKKFFRNINSDNILPLEFIYANTSIEDVLSRQDYFDQTYFYKQETSSKKIYAQIMTEFGEQGDLIKAAHAFYSPDYFYLKYKKEKLESELYVLNACEPKDINLQNTIDSTKEQISLTMTKLDNHFFSKVDQENKKGTGESMEKITQKYMKYYKIPKQYRRNFFLIINYLNHYYKLQSDIFKKAEEHNKKLEIQVLNSPNFDAMVLYFMKEYIGDKQIKETIQKKRDKNYQLKISEIKKKLGVFYTQRDLNIDQTKKIPQIDQQLTLNF